ncbi:MAG TPA: alpha-amylase family glycosyl hydrolase, partial [Jatrophihabitantaceae bacterium]
PEVTEEFERILRFWLDRGVDGFRIDVGHGMAKPGELSDMDLAVLVPSDHGGPHSASLDDPRWDQEHVHDYHRGFRRVLDSYPGDRMAVGEMWVANDDRLARYVRHDELSLAFNFELVLAQWGAASFRRAIDSSLAAMAQVGAPCTWVLGNHDVDRPATRYGGGSRGLGRARAAALVQLSLPGATYVYNGEELGLANVDLPDEALRDPTWERSGHRVRGRDGERVPLPWSGAAPPFGFSSSAKTWLPMPAYWAGRTARDQADDTASTLALYRDALRVRRELLAAAPDFAWLDSPPDVLAYRRGPLAVLLNASVSSVPTPDGEVLVASGPLDPDGAVPPDTAVWVRVP